MQTASERAAQQYAAPEHADREDPRDLQSARPKTPVLRIDPVSGLIDGADSIRLTADEFAALDHPPCPHCGRPVYLRARHVTESEGEPCWTIGSWHCPSGCAPGSG